MSIGDTLARARQGAGLSIIQISQRTRIRETVIRGIENDDFSLCGGDFYARGHIRSVAKVAGVDADPLIQEYDAAHGGIRQASAAEIFEPATPIKLRGRRAPNWSAAMALAIAAVVICGIVRACGSPSHHVNAAAHHGPVPMPPDASPAHRAAPAATPGHQHRPVLVQLAATEGCCSWARASRLLLDEPLAGFGPLARREFLQTLLEGVAGAGPSCCLRTSSLTLNGSATT